jgi:Bacterial regulatory protein, Fis family
MTPMLPVAAVERALVEAAGNVTAAARTLGIARTNLRELVRTHPLLMNVVFEQIEQEIDASWQVLRDCLRSDNARTRTRAAAYIVRHTEAGRRRGWGSRRSSHNEPAEPKTVTLKWLDT